MLLKDTQDYLKEVFGCSCVEDIGKETLFSIAENAEEGYPADIEIMIAYWKAKREHHTRIHNEH